MDVKKGPLFNTWFVVVLSYLLCNITSLLFFFFIDIVIIT